MGKTVKQTRAGATTTPRQSLAATHPSNYFKAASTTMPPPPAPMLTGQNSTGAAKAKSPFTTTSPVHPYPTPSLSPPEKLHHDFNTLTTGKQMSKDPRACAPDGRHLERQNQFTQTSGAKQHGVARPWEQHNDPTFTVSDSPPFWNRNHTVLKADTNVENSLISPTFMHGLPFGSMTEAAHHYPSEENLSCLK